MNVATPRANCNPALFFLFPARCRRRRGVTLMEAVVLLLAASALILIIAAALPRQRETARALSCRTNLMKIGVALGVYHQGGSLPFIPSPLPTPLPEPQPTSASIEKAAGSPLGSLLMATGLSDFQALAGVAERDAKLLADTTRPRMIAQGRIAGFLCPSDDRIRQTDWSAPASYRACAGDRIEGRNGVFAPGRSLTYEEVQSADGAGFASVFSERLIGGGVPETLGLASYHQGPGSIDPEQCPNVSAASASADAGWSWSETSWRSSLYNHAITPNADPSCVSADAQTARMGASSAHPQQIHVLMLDGRVQVVTPTINAKIWRMMANIRDAAPSPAP